jgi:hypothetical protein
VTEKETMRASTLAAAVLVAALVAIVAGCPSTERVRHDPGSRIVAVRSPVPFRECESSRFRISSQHRVVLRPEPHSRDGAATRPGQRVMILGQCEDGGHLEVVTDQNRYGWVSAPEVVATADSRAASVIATESQWNCAPGAASSGSRVRRV